MCDYSMHSHYEDIANGYITLPNGSRVGLCGTAVYEKNLFKSVKDISCMNIRIPRCVSGISEILFKKLITNELQSMIIAGPPSSGKTTLLKDISYQLSSGRLGRYYKVSIVDERKEICPEKNDIEKIGPNTDILLGYPKSTGMSIAVRTLSPEIIICDEIGFNDEINEIINGINSGIHFILTIHANSYDELKRKVIFSKLIKASSFLIIFVNSSEFLFKFYKRSYERYFVVFNGNCFFFKFDYRYSFLSFNEYTFIKLFALKWCV
jgi:stage III sporulation protein AA